MQITPLRDWALIESEQSVLYKFSILSQVYICVCAIFMQNVQAMYVMLKLFHLMNVLRRYYNHLKLGHFSAKTFIDRQSKDLCLLLTN